MNQFTKALLLAPIFLGGSLEVIHLAGPNELGRSLPVVTDAGDPPPTDKTIAGQNKRAYLIVHSPNRSSIVSYSTSGKFVRFATRELGDNQQTLGVKTKTRALSFWPTCIRLLSSDELAVAGLTSRGLTIIEIWTLSNGGVTTNVDPATQVITYIVTPPSVRLVRRVHEEVHVLRNMVVEMIELVQPPNGPQPELSLLLQFFNSRDVYKFGLDSGLQSLVATKSSPSPPGVFSFPGMMPSQFSSFLDHQDLGYTYLFWTDNRMPWFALIDSNRDGILDAGFDLSTDAEVDALELRNRSKIMGGKW